jgi:hypothetical protein
MADTVTLSRRSQRTATIRRRATLAGVGGLVGAFVLVTVTTSLPADQPATVPAASSGQSMSTPAQPRQAAPAAATSRRIKTRQS